MYICIMISLSIASDPQVLMRRVSLSSSRLRREVIIKRVVVSMEFFLGDAVDDLCCGGCEEDSGEISKVSL